MSFPGSTNVLYRHDLVIPFFSFLSFHAYVARLITILQEQNAISESQYAERISNKTEEAINETFTELKLMLQGFRIHFV